MKKNIAVFDSGMGGLTVLKELYKLLPHENYLYYADTKNVPYGTKSKEEILCFMEEAVTYLIRQNIKLLVIACNSATSVAIKQLREKYDFPIVGMEPAVKPALENSHEKKVLVTATSITLKEEKLKNLISSVGHGELIEKMALDKLVTFAEAFNFEGNDVQNYLIKKLSGLDIQKFSSMVLGCTHFIYYKEMIRKILCNSSISIIDGNDGTVRQVKKILTREGQLNQVNGGKINVIRSGDNKPNIEVINKMKEYLQN